MNRRVTNNRAEIATHRPSPDIRNSWINEFLWTCAGVNKHVIRQCPEDYAKYAGIGGTILFTALMASLSGGYAMNFVFDSTRVAIAFGIFWGMLIFNLDRFIVNTMYSDGKHSISWAEVKSGLPRISMAIFLGLVISTPLEMKIFEDRINSQLVLDNIRRTNISRDEVKKGLQPLETRMLDLEKQHDEIQKRLADADQELMKEGEGSALSQRPGHGPIYEDKKANRDAIQRELNKWEAVHENELQNLKTQINTITEKGEGDIAKGNEENGFCVRYEAFSHIRSQSPVLNIVSIVIMLLFVIIETAPTFFKMMMEDGPYDDLLNAEKHKVRVLSQKRISDINDEVNTSVMISTMKNQKRLEAEIKANEGIMLKIATIQSSLLEEALELWRQEELNKIHENPSRYIIRQQDNLQHYQQPGEQAATTEHESQADQQPAITDDTPQSDDTAMAPITAPQEPLLEGELAPSSDAPTTADMDSDEQEAHNPSDDTQIQQ